jgi:hypothetical protein
MIQFNYGEYIFQQLILTEFVKKKLAFILIAIITNIIQIHIVSILCYVLSINKYLDFVIQICISVLMSLNVDYIYNAVERYEKEFILITQYIINNYTFENYKYWKRIIVLSTGIYACILLCFIDITNKMLILYILQYMICFLIIEQFEQKRIQTLLYNYKSKPIKKKYDNNDINIIDSYIHIKNNKKIPLIVKNTSKKHTII